ncbi:DUF3592 domain-containing protein [Amycolatopsis australiensis]|uniref:DUF3592 domain-containing protein n=1 Tax=Amycolatopsis australiensis TaxID=546364 RepID=A0A1K1T1H3_9PSEU|nr:DUF3592 domain-containing protein [Amycolatopsis australiensis]SFW90374.1 hypothetical protein SAMN04489730_7539 [Amycolatopsis australiensis]
MALDDPGRRRVAWLAVVVISGLVFLIVTAGMAYSLLAPGYVFEDGELPIEAAVLAGSLALSAFGARRVRAADLVLRDRVPDDGAWLPPERATGDGDVDLDAETRGLRRTARRAAALVLVWAAVSAGGLAGLLVAEQSAADLLATGVRTPGVVVSVHDRTKGSPSIWVRYRSPGASWAEEIVSDSGRAYHRGDPVTVVYDPARPERARTTEEPNEDQVLVGFGVIALLLGFAGLPVAVAAAAGWRRRARAVARTGWRVATVTVVPHPGRRRWPSEVRVRYRDGSGIVLGCTLSTRGTGVPAGRVKRAWVGGWGRQMVVLFPRGARKPGPHAMPAYAIGSRLSRFRR